MGDNHQPRIDAETKPFNADAIHLDHLRNDCRHWLSTVNCSLTVFCRLFTESGETHKQFQLRYPALQNLRWNYDYGAFLSDLIRFPGNVDVLIRRIVGGNGDLTATIPAYHICILKR